MCATKFDKFVHKAKNLCPHYATAVVVQIHLKRSVCRTFWQIVTASHRKAPGFARRAIPMHIFPQRFQTSCCFSGRLALACRWQASLKVDLLYDRYMQAFKLAKSSWKRTFAQQDWNFTSSNFYPSLLERNNSFSVLYGCSCVYCNDTTKSHIKLVLGWNL